MRGDGEAFGDADENTMGLDVLTQVVDLGLLHITQIADAENDGRVVCSEWNVDGQHVAPFGSRNKGCRYDVVVLVPPRKNLVV